MASLRSIPRATATCVTSSSGRPPSTGADSWSPGGSAIYNPLARGNPSEITDKALAGEEWSEPHYLRQAQRYINVEL